MANYTKIDGSTFDTKDPSNGIIPFSMSVEGTEGSGKTWLSLMTTPLPVVHVNFSDREATHFLYDMCEERRAKTTLYSFQAANSTGWSRAEGMESLKALSDIAQEELLNNKLHGGTFVIDSGSSWWEVMQEVYVKPKLEAIDRDPDKKRRGGLEYGEANLVVKGIINWLKAQGAFFIMTHQKVQEWGPSGPIPGMYRTRGINSQVAFMVEVRADVYKTCNVCGSPECRAKGHVGRSHWARITKFGKNSAMEGMDIPGPTFSTIYGLYSGRPLPKGAVPEDKNGDE